MEHDNLISILETTYKQTRQAQDRLVIRLNELESESNRVRSEIEVLDNSASQTQTAIISLLESLNQGSASRNLSNRAQNDHFDNDIQRMPRITSANPPTNISNYRQNGYLQTPNTRHSNGNNLHQNVEPLHQRFADRTITQACSLLLREIGGPLHVNELYNYLIDGSFPFTGSNPTISIAVSLSRNKRFRKVAPGTFDLVMRDASKAS